MVAKRITPLLLAASVLVCGFSGGFLSNQSAMAITRVDELSDVQESNWAYDALKDLVEKYNVIEGYPDKTFRGAKYANRYELAAALNATIKSIGKEIARLGAEKADKKDLATVARLQQEFATELTALQARTDALEARATKIEAKNDEQDNRLAILEKMKVYGDVSFGGYADISGNPGSSFSDAISSVGRTRVNFDYAAVDDKGGSVVGPGTIHSRLVAAFGRVSPLEAGSDVLGRNGYSGISNIAGDASLYNEGIRTNDSQSLFSSNSRVGGGNLRANAYIDSTYYSQVLRAELPFIPKDDSWRTSFNLSAGLIPWRDFYFKSPYQGVENTQFQNTALVVNPAIITSNIVPRIVATMDQGLGKYSNLKFKADVSSIDVSDTADGIGFTFESDLGYNLGFLDSYFGTQNAFNLAGNLFGGYYLIHSNNGATNNILNVSTNGVSSNGNDTTQGFYVGLNQELYKGLGVFGNYAMNTTGVVSPVYNALQNGTGANVLLDNNNLVFGVRQAWTVGSELPIRALPNLITFGKRQRDAFGAAYAQISANTSPGTAASTIVSSRASEKILEMYYRLQVTDNFAFIPSTQLRFDRLGSSPNNTEVIIGLRTSFVF